MNRQLPEWLEAAFTTVAICSKISAQSLRDQLISRWLDIESDVLPALAKLSDIGKQLIFEQVFMATISGYATIRQAQKDLLAVRKKIISQTQKLVDLIQEAQDIATPYGMSSGVPDLWETLELAAERWKHWHSVMESDVHLRDFFRVANGQGFQGPEWIDLLQELETGVDEEKMGTSAVPAIESRKQEADDIRTLQSYISRLYHPEVPRSFKLPDMEY